MNSSFFSLIEAYWTAYQLALAVLCLWIAVTVFHQRSAATWMTLTSAIFLPALMLGSRLVSTMHFSRPGYSNLLQALSIGQSVAILTFLIGLLLHLHRRKLEASRIADLEAILHDLQQRQADAPSHPPR